MKQLDKWNYDMEGNVEGKKPHYTVRAGIAVSVSLQSSHVYLSNMYLVRGMELRQEKKYT